MRRELLKLARELRERGMDDAKVEKALTRYLAVRFRVAGITVASRTPTTVRRPSAPIR